MKWGPRLGSIFEGWEILDARVNVEKAGLMGSNLDSPPYSWSFLQTLFLVPAMLCTTPGPET